MLERRLGAGAREKKAQHGRGLKRVGWSLGPDSEPSATDPSKWYIVIEFWTVAELWHIEVF